MISKFGQLGSQMALSYKLVETKSETDYSKNKLKKKNVSLDNYHSQKVRYLESRKLKNMI